MRCDLTCATCRTAWGFRTQERNALRLEERNARNRIWGSDCVGYDRSKAAERN